MCRVERWSIRTLRAKIGGTLFERTAPSRKPHSTEHIGSSAKERPGREGLLKSAHRERIRQVGFSARPSCSA
jgi:predicted nuclease of restriction endonuclease-like (RecB) superfamily